MTLPFDFTRRRALQLLAAGPATAVAAASTPLLAQPATARAPLQIVGPWEIAGLSPASSGHVFTRMQITETLMNASDDGMPLPGLAER